MKKHHVLAAATLVLMAAVAGPVSVRAQADRFEALADLPFQENRPTAETAKTLMDELLFQRATQT